MVGMGECEKICWICLCFGEIIRKNLFNGWVGSAKIALKKVEVGSLEGAVGSEYIQAIGDMVFGS